MEKTFSKIEINLIKSQAKNAAPYVAKKQKIDAKIKEVEEKIAEQIRKRAQEKIEKLEAEKKSYQTIIDSMNQTVKTITGGYTTEDLVISKKEGTGNIDPNTGKEIMKTVYVLKYPETVVPPTETIVPPTTEDGPGSDFDADKEASEGVEEMPEELMAEKAEGVEEAASTDPFIDDPIW